MIKASLRGLLQRKLRLALAVLAIVLSVAFLSGAMVLTATLGARFTALFSTLNQNVAVQVQAKDSGNQDQPLSPQDRPKLSQADLDRLANVDGVRRVQGDVSTEGVVPFKKSTGKAVSVGGAPALGVGVDVPSATADDELSLLHLTKGTWPTSPDEVTLTTRTAKLAEVQVGDQVKIFIPLTQEAKQFRVAGLAEYEGGRSSLGGETLILFEQTTAQQLFYGKTGVFAGASLAAKDGVSQDELRKRVETVIPADFVAKTGKQAAKDESSAITDVFNTLSSYLFTPFVAIAILVGIFLIYNTFNIVVAQRARELALLRALGASWSQVTVTVLVEALIVGGVGATLGLLAGIGVGVGGEAWLSKVLGLELPSGGLVVSPWAVIWSYGVGVLVTVIAAFVPAIKAALVPPVAAMREVIRPDKKLTGLSIVGGAFALAGGAVLALALNGLGSFTLIALGGGLLLLFLGAAFLSPLLSKPIVRLLGWIVGRGQAGKLGVRNALRNPRRTAVTAAALMIGVTLISTAGVVAASFKSTIASAVSTDVGAELFVQGGQQGPPGTGGFDPKALEKVAALPGVKTTLAEHISFATIGGQQNFVVALDLNTAKDMFTLKQISGEVRELKADELIVDDQTAKDAGWTVGKTFSVVLPKRTSTYTVVGIYERSPVANGIIVGTPAIADFTGPLAAAGFIKLKDGADADAVQKDVEQALADYPFLTVSSQADYVKQTTQILDIVLGVISVLLGVAIAIALLGILNTLLLSIVERTRELGLVRAIGLSRRGIMSMVSVESVLIATFGCLLGMALGVGLGSAVVTTFIHQKSFNTLTLPWASLAGYFVVAIVAGVIAALWPAWRAARLNVLEAIAYE
jgi:putative ABC transport system permease protein